MKLNALGVAAVAGLILTGCQKPAEPAATTDAAATTTTPAVGPVTLPVSINAVMVGLIDHSSDAIFDVGNGKVPKTDDDWREVEYHAYQMAVGAKTIQLPGTGPMDATWVANADWTKNADAMSAAGMEALKLAQAKDAKGFEAVANKLVDTCDTCHKQFKPDIPTMGIMHKPDFPHKK